ncbi:MAG: Hpt domain-containing protein [Xanthomonadales bacterium]|nr:Hpt domain-containing protein [Xanthomonadales bacterium]
MDDAQDNALLGDFLVETEELLQRLGAQLIRLEAAPADQDLLDAAFRGFHSIKGGAGFLDLDAVVVVCHHAEELLKAARQRRVVLATPGLDALLDAVDAIIVALAEVAAGNQATAPADSLLRRLWPAAPAAAIEPPVRVVAPAAAAMGDDEFEALLDSLHGPAAPGSDAAPHGLPIQAATPSMVHVPVARLDELDLRVAALEAACGRLDGLARRDADGVLALTVAELGRAATDLRATAQGLRLQPAGVVFRRFPRVVRNLARKLGKDVELVIAGADVDLDRSAADALADALVHLLRNAVDHGIGTPEERRHRGMPARGRITLEASRRDGCVLVTVSDDGRGIDPAALRRRAVDQGLLDAVDAARLDVGGCLDLVFRPGFSTAMVASEISGRGFGMDVVRTRLAELGGSVELRSTPGHGTQVELRIPQPRAMPAAAAAWTSKPAGAVPARQSMKA